MKCFFVVIRSGVMEIIKTKPCYACVRASGVRINEVVRENKTSGGTP